MKEKLRSLARSFEAAGNGVHFTAMNERNMRIHLSFAAYVIFFGIIGKVNYICWAVFFLCFAGVICAELINTAVEKLCDVTNPEYNPTIGVVKDVAAGAVLIAAICSAAAGLCIFLSPEIFTNVISTVFGNWWLCPVIAISLIIDVCLIFKRK